MTSLTGTRLPDHLKKYVVEQNYERYTPEDQAVWRYIMRQLKSFLSQHAHESYLDGLTKTGITTDRIPKISDIDQHLEKFGWGAVPVSGFIPPAAFMEFQSLGILPIASDMRTLDHLLYTPAPDIVHEAAGHAPILIHPEFADYLRKYAEVARHAILSKEDLDQYEAIRILSDVKEDPQSTAADIAKADIALQKVNASLRYVSEAGLLSRMNWWTAEYGLIGSLESPKIFGAGLLSSVGESRECLGPKVKRIPLSIDCVDYSYDITEPQPQLFVTPNFATLNQVLEQLAERLAYRRGGMYGLTQANLSRAVNTVQLNSKIQISGVLEKYYGEGFYLKFSGPCQISLNRQEIKGQGVSQHAHGYSTPVGLLEATDKCLSNMTVSELSGLGLKLGSKVNLRYRSGVNVSGTLVHWEFDGTTLILLKFKDCHVTLGSETLFDPSWGEYDLAVGTEVTSVFAGPADRHRFGITDDFVAKRVPEKKYAGPKLLDFKFYNATHLIRENLQSPSNLGVFKDLSAQFLAPHEENWLKGIELLELSYLIPSADSERTQILNKLKSLENRGATIKMNIEDGIKLSSIRS